MISTNKKKLISTFLFFALTITLLTGFMSTQVSAYDENMIIRVGLYYSSSALSSVSVNTGTISIGSGTSSLFIPSVAVMEVGYSDGTNFTPIGNTSNASFSFGASTAFSAIGTTVQEYNTANADNGRVFALRFANGAIRINSNSFYTGYLEFRTTSGYLEIINVLPLEDYLKCVVPAEMPSYFATEALKAQAIAARSWSIRNISKHSSQGFNFCSTTDCQAYEGSKKRTSKTDQAVDATKGEIIVYNGKVADATYYSSSGGSTVSAKSMWGGSTSPYLAAVRVPEETHYMKWNISISLSDLYNNVLKFNSNFSTLSGLKSFEISSLETGSDHVIAVKATDNNGKIITLSGGSKVYSLISSIGKVTNNNYSSTNFVIKYAYSMAVTGFDETTYTENVNVITEDGQETYVGAPSSLNVITASGVQSSNFASDSLVFEGKGWGHGVGMSQFGANDLAKTKKEDGVYYTYVDILKRFYTGVEIKKLSDLN
ncbi:MAG: hypothetical protein A2Y17_01905 [Clostridiales bacterium GWF2_38_85]|nr:MAG: hypothetical protein A2Y17_01905 [Clostridiales bacterium GWF2_38_85]HBL84735.1 hypothetical protein [Clostridiales bacterium]